MTTKDIKVGVTYRNRNKGKTTRTVLAIADEHRPHYWYGVVGSEAPDEPGVLYEQDGVQHTLYLSSFTRWVGSAVA